MNDYINKSSQLFPEMRFKNERTIVKQAKVNPGCYDSSKEVAKKDLTVVSSNRRSYSTNDSSNKSGLPQANVCILQDGISIKPKKKEKLVINVKYCQYDIIPDVAKELGFRVSRSDKAEYDIMWCDLAPSTNLLSKMQKFQRTNHFPGMNQVANKSNLARNLLRVAKLHPNSYSFFPQTWLLPSELHELK